MIPLLPLLALAHQGFAPSQQPAWVDALLRDAPPSLVMPPPKPPRPRSRPGEPTEDRVLPPGAILPDEMPTVAAHPSRARSDPWKILQTRASDLIAHGKFEEAYRLEAGCHGDDELFDVDRLSDAALLTGRYAEAQRLLVQTARLRGAVGDRALSLSLASAAQGRTYPGQGAWVLDSLRDSLSYDLKRAPLGAHYEVPTGRADVASLSVLALGVAEGEPAYLEWALRLEPRCELAGSDLVDLYALRRRPADAIRVAASMVRTLPAGPARERFAARLKELKAKADAPKA